LPRSSLCCSHLWLQRGVTGAASKAETRGAHPVVTEDSARKLLLVSTNVLISLGPASTRTEKLVDASVFTAMPQGPVFISTERGPTLRRLIFYQPSKILGCPRQVRQIKPLPSSSPLWTTDGKPHHPPRIARSRPQTSGSSAEPFSSTEAAPGRFHRAF
jgi:hypothetical protein